MKMKRLYLVRHGLAEVGSGRAVGHLDPPLSAAGAESIAKLAGSWRGPAPARVVSSDLRRAADSARLLAARLGAVAEADPRLRELAFGEWEGLTWDEIHRRDERRLAAWGDRWWEVAPPGGETFAELSRRVREWLEDLGSGGEPVVAVAHAGSLRALLGALLARPRRELFDLKLDHAHVSALTVDEGRGELLYLNRDCFGS
ncbi:MAG: histidine phosphatase family protein [Acidobacteria bacterium]|nr:histidine phosphatase family protein [Acidobacteriota bacterium]